MKASIHIKVIGALLVVGFAAACSSASKDKATQLEELRAQQTKLGGEIRKLEAELAAENPVSKAKMKDVGVIELAPRSFDYFIQTQGAVEAIDNIMVSARAMGNVAQVLSREGDIVSKADGFE